MKDIDFHKKVSGLAFRFIFKSMLISNFSDNLNRMYITMSMNCCMHGEINFVHILPKDLKHLNEHTG